MFVAGCRLRFDALGDATVDTMTVDTRTVDPDAILERCGPAAILCDDFESDSFDPWGRDTSGGSIVVEAGCGAGGSRCAHSINTTPLEGARLDYEISSSHATLDITATVIPRMLVNGDAQLIGFDFRDGSTLVTQVGAQTHDGALSIYEYNFVNMMLTTSQTTSPSTVDVPMLLSPHVDHVARTATLDRDGTQIATIALTPGAVPTTSKALVGLWSTMTTQVYDFDDVVVQ